MPAIWNFRIFNKNGKTLISVFPFLAKIRKFQMAAIFGEGKFFKIFFFLQQKLFLRFSQISVLFVIYLYLRAGVLACRDWLLFTTSVFRGVENYFPRLFFVELPLSVTGSEICIQPQRYGHGF